jgi:hypothetical protein
LLHLVQRGDSGAGEEVDIATQVAPVRLERVRGQAPLDGEVVEVGLDRPDRRCPQPSTSSSLTEGRPWASPTGA